MNHGDKKVKKREFPHTLVIIFSIIIFAAILTYIIPAGAYERVEDLATGRIVVDPASFHFISRTPAMFIDIFTSIPRGMQETAWISFLVFIVGGTFSMIENTGAIQSFLGKIMHSAKGKDWVLIPVIVLGFSLIPTFIGTMEAYLAFIPIGILFARTLGFDALVGISIVLAAGNAGLASAITNPFTAATAQQLVGLPVYSAAHLRVAAFILFNVSVSFWTIRYALKVKKDPKKSIIYDLEQNAKELEMRELPPLNGRNIAILLTVAAGMCVVIYGALNGMDFKTEVPAVFLIMFIVVGVIAGHSVNRMAEEFVAGAKKMVMGVMVVGFAKGISIVLGDGNIVDTIVYGLSGLLVGLPKVFGALAMYIIQIIMNCFIISGAGQAAATIPIMSPLGDVIGITQQTVVSAFQYGDGITNLLLPMSPATMGAIAFASIPYPKYVRFIWKIILSNLIIGGAIVAFAAITNVGPF